MVDSHKLARRIKLEEEKKKLDDEQKTKQKPVKQLEAERREEGLNVAISSENKGFAMLAKMGYKQGDAIGRSSTGIVEPISIQIKCDRAGLGREAAIKQLEEYKERLRKAKTEAKGETSTVSLDQFRQRMAQKNSGRQLEADLWYYFSICFLCSYYIFIFFIYYLLFFLFCIFVITVNVSVHVKNSIWTLQLKNR